MCILVYSVQNILVCNNNLHQNKKSSMSTIGACVCVHVLAHVCFFVFQYIQIHMYRYSCLFI